MFERPRSGERAVLVRLGFGAAVDPEDLRELEYASLLHDFGKIGVREKVLVKAKKLYDERLELVRAHPPEQNGNRGRPDLRQAELRQSALGAGRARSVAIPERERSRG